MRRGASMRVGFVVLAVFAGSCATTPGALDDERDASTAGDVTPGDPGGCTPGGASAQFRAQVRPPSRMLPGARAEASVTFDNCSGASWRAGQVSLVPAPGAGDALGVVRVALTADVPDGARVTVPFTVQAPQEAGVYHYAWAIARDGAETFQQATPAGEVSVFASADCTEDGPAVRLRGQTAPPDFVGLGERVRGSVTLANCGTETWRAEDGYHLAPSGTAHWQTTRVALPREVPFGAEVTIPIEGTAPRAQGRYPFTWVLQKGTDRRGDPTPAAQITVLPRATCGVGAPPARFVAQSAPDVLDPGQGANVDLTFANCGSEPWGAAHRINAAAPAADGRWGAGNIPFPLPVGVGFQLTVPFRITAPRDAGSYPYRWAVTRAGAELAEPSPMRSITVRVIDTAGPCQARPVAGNVTDPFGYRVHPISGRWLLHTGIDFGARAGTPIYACRGGTVVRASWYGGYGNAIIVDHGGGMQTLYAHQSAFAVGEGAHVTAGQNIGFVGSTGNSTGPHLHFEVLIHGTPVDPARGYL
ncbi:MAG: M23 family metallopeptidase [Polyangiales bacterium]